MPSKADRRAPASKLLLVTDETTHTLTLDGKIVSFALRRSRRRSIGLSIDQRGLRVGAPRHASLGEVENLIRRHADWIAKKLADWAARLVPESLQIVDGMQLPLLGRPLRVRLSIGGNRAVWSETDDPVLTLCLRTPKDAPSLLEKTLCLRAHQFFSARLRHLAETMALSSPPLALSSARTRWGSCSLKSGIRLNWRLIHFAPHVIDYVLIHELAHLVEMNHSRRFWAIVARFCPDYRTRRQELNHQAAACPRW